MLCDSSHQNVNQKKGKCVYRFSSKSTLVFSIALSAAVSQTNVLARDPVSTAESGDGITLAHDHDASSDLIDLGESEEGEQKKDYDEVQISAESHRLSDLVTKDVTKNLVHQHPSIVLNAAQKVASWILVKPPKRIVDPEYRDGEVDFYPVFSAGVAETNGKRLTGQYKPIQKFADWILAASKGNGVEDKMLLFRGPAGTGKSFFLGILSTLAENLTSKNPDFFVYSYEWKGLTEFAALKDFFNSYQDSDGKVKMYPYPCPLNESPYNLLPEAYATRILNQVKEKARKIAHANPTPRRLRCSQCEVIRNHILADYMKQHNLKTLTPFQELQAVEPYVTVKRLVIGPKGTLARLDAEPREPDLNALISQPNPLNMNLFGPSNPFSYFLNGKLPQANGSVIMFDEFFRNHTALRDLALGIIEERKFRRGGAPEIQIDAVIFGASNNESIDEASKTKASKAHLDRTLQVTMGYLLNPIEEAKNLLAMNGVKQFKMQKIGSDESADAKDFLGRLGAALPVLGAQSAPIAALDLDELFPLPQGREERVGPDRRFKLWYTDRGLEGAVHVSPHTLMYMAMVISATRLVIDQRAALKYGPFQVISNPAFFDPFTRLQVWLGKHTINATEEADLRSLSNLLNEGHFGITERNAAKGWLYSSLVEAGRGEGEHCLTPQIAYETLKKLLQSKEVEFDGKDVNLGKWVGIADDFAKKFLLPEIQKDLSIALGSGMGVIDSMYQEIFAEIQALSSDENARTYKYKGETRNINHPRLAEVKQLYFQTQGKKLSISALAILPQVSTGGAIGKVRSPGLVDAIAMYLAKRETEKLTYDDLLRVNDTQEGSNDARDKHSELAHVLSHELGYCNKCIGAALRLAQQTISRTEQVK